MGLVYLRVKIFRFGKENKKKYEKKIIIKKKIIKNQVILISKNQNY